MTRKVTMEEVKAEARSSWDIIVIEIATVATNSLYTSRIAANVLTHNFKICDNFYSSLITWANNLSHLIDFSVAIPYCNIEIYISQSFNQTPIFYVLFEISCRMGLITALCLQAWEKPIGTLYILAQTKILGVCTVIFRILRNLGISI